MGRGGEPPGYLAGRHLHQRLWPGADQPDRWVGEPDLHAAGRHQEQRGADQWQRDGQQELQVRRLRGGRSSSGSGSTEFRYAAEQFDDTLNLIYLRARYYDPATGRFLSKDPAGGKLSSPVTQNKYVYAGNNPVNGGDPTGLTYRFNDWTYPLGTSFDDAVAAGTIRIPNRGGGGGGVSAGRPAPTQVDGSGGSRPAPWPSGEGPEPSEPFCGGLELGVNTNFVGFVGAVAMLVCAFPTLESTMKIDFTMGLRHCGVPGARGCAEWESPLPNQSCRGSYTRLGAFGVCPAFWPIIIPGLYEAGSIASVTWGWGQ
ncbi:MAG: RHS repeat-associated core domain-containing protein [Chloroflexi bacterium]|nr:RHS repeat-associated core domain-containing protein [Chloroflexota bacterium]